MTADIAKSMKSNRRALVTGATGFVGSNLVRVLLASGWEVHAIIRAPSQPQIYNFRIQDITTHLHDGTMSGMMKIVEAAKPNVVYHIASMVVMEHRLEDIDQLINANILFSTQLVEAMYRNGTKNLVNTETFWQHCKGTEDFDPVCLYAATKQAFRDILIHYVDSGSINAISLVLYDNYGPNDPRKKIFAYLKQAVKEQRQVDMTPGEQIVDMTHVNDVAAAYLRAGEILLSETGCRLCTYSVSSGRRMTLKQLVELTIQETGIELQPNWGGRPYRINEVMQPWQCETLPGWKPKVELAAGIRDLFDKFD